MRCNTGFIALGFLLHWASSATADTPAGAQAKMSDGVRVTVEQLLQIKTVEAKPTPFQTEQIAFGQLAYNDEATTPVMAPMTGRVTKLIANLGDRVKRGAPLLEIRSPDVVQLHNDLIASVQTHATAVDRDKYLRRVLERQLTLMAARATNQRDVDSARSDVETGEAALKAAAAALEANRNRFDVSLGRTVAERRRVEQDNVIDPHVIVTAPIDGTVISRKVGPGQLVRSDTPEPLYSIADLSVMWLKINVPESVVAQVRDGDQIEVVASAFPNRPIKAKVAAIGALLDTNIRRVVVRADVPNPDGSLKAGMLANGRILTGTAATFPAVPVASVIRDGDETSVWIEHEPRVYKRRVVKLGMETRGMIQVREGLAGGEKVVAGGAIFLDNEWRQ